ncbi:hypothetical protein L1F30_01145 [Simiduia sp. 21SJ11W-1]|uniref:hypothetical protein n=1 Tax=Simiduia sp. 21SJ11W-1 TaxID=2909669 RepID=UPI0020A13E04|nr:hypothetical protein [Simiduia sp. 21SJ11W-1]UTA48162.1 hypothetical protein L1F30_01145 [Simiduia sp. 21SJ11W-1]
MKYALFAVAITLTSAATAETYVCTNGGMERSISVVYLEPGQAVPCEVQYTKDGESRILWRAQNESGYCESQARAFADKQSSWGWACELSGSESTSNAQDTTAEDTEIEPAEGADGQ